MLQHTIIYTPRPEFITIKGHHVTFRLVSIRYFKIADSNSSCLELKGKGAFHLFPYPTPEQALEAYNDLAKQLRVLPPEVPEEKATVEEKEPQVYLCTLPGCLEAATHRVKDGYFGHGYTPYLCKSHHSDSNFHLLVYEPITQ